MRGEMWGRRGCEVRVVLGGGAGCVRDPYRRRAGRGMLRSYHSENAGSHQIPEAKLSWAGLVLDSGMIWDPVS